MRIVSLSPATTEIVVALGLGDALVDITSAPDLVLTGGPSVPEADGSPRSTEPGWALDPGVHVVSLEPTSIEGIFNSIATIGALAGAEDAAVDLVASLRERLADVEETVAERRAAGHAAPRVVALEQLEPPFAAGLWVPEQVRRAGAWELLGESGAPSVETTWAAVREVDPEMLVLMPRGLGVNEAAAAWARTARPRWWRTVDAVRRGQVFAVDGSAYFSRPGPRVVDGIELLAEIFDPDAFIEIAPPGSWTPVS